IGMARNIARNEARRLGRERLLPPEDMPEIPTPPEPPSDPRLARAIADCLELLTGRPLTALRARMRSQGLLPHRELPKGLRMSVNVLLQNIVRARRQLAACLTRHQVPLEEILR